MLGLLVLSSDDGTCGGRRSLLMFRSDLSFGLDAMHRHTRTPALIDRMKTDEFYIISPPSSLPSPLKSSKSKTSPPPSLALVYFVYHNSALSSNLYPVCDFCWITRVQAIIVVVVVVVFVSH